MEQNWSLSRSLLFLSQKSSAVTLNSVHSSISLCRVALYIVTLLLEISKGHYNLYHVKIFEKIKYMNDEQLTKKYNMNRQIKRYFISTFNFFFLDLKRNALPYSYLQALLHNSPTPLSLFVLF